MPPIDGHAVPRKSPQVTSRIIEEEAILLRASKGEVKILNEVGTRVWELIDGKRSCEEIAETIFDEYEVTREKALDDVKKFLLELEEHGAVEPLALGSPEKKT